MSLNWKGVTRGISIKSRGSRGSVMDIVSSQSEGSLGGDPIPRSDSQLLHHQTSTESRESNTSTPPKRNHQRRHSLNPANIFRRVSMIPLSRRMSVRRRSKSAKTSQEEMSTTSQPHLNQIMKRTAYSPKTGLDRTQSVSGAFFRRTQSNRKYLKNISSQNISVRYQDLHLVQVLRGSKRPKLSCPQ